MKRAFSASVKKPAFFLLIFSVVCWITNGQKLNALSTPSASISEDTANSKDNYKFEVAAIHLNKRGGLAGSFTYPGGKLKFGFCTVEALIMYAYDIQSYQITGGPSWIHSNHYDIQAIPPSTSPTSKLNPSSTKLPLTFEQRLMLQNLLADRFHLRIHIEKKVGAVFDMTRGNKLISLKPAKDSNEYPWIGSNSGGSLNGDGIKGVNANMSLLAKKLSRYLEKPVIDKTGLSGAYDFEYSYTSTTPDEDISISLINSLKGIGLNIKSAKGQIETYVIDQLETPTEN